MIEETQMKGQCPENDWAQFHTDGLSNISSGGVTLQGQQIRILQEENTDEVDSSCNLTGRLLAEQTKEPFPSPCTFPEHFQAELTSAELDGNSPALHDLTRRLQLS